MLSRIRAIMAIALAAILFLTGLASGVAAMHLDRQGCGGTASAEMKNPFQGIRQKFNVSDEALWESIYKYEKYVVSCEDGTWGYIKSTGYPMYLITLAKMYLYMYKNTSSPYHFQKFSRACYFIEKIRNPDWTWSYFDNASNKPSLYNWLVNDLYLDAYNITKERHYIDQAAFIARGFINTSFETPYNYRFFSFVSIGYYLGISGNSDISLTNFGRKLFNESIAGYVPSTGMWFYSPGQKSRYFYDGHAAGYQLGEMYWFLKYRVQIKSVFPDIYIRFINYLPKMMSVVEQYVLPSGTYYYSPSAPDYTEGAGGMLLALEIYDRTFGTDHFAVKNSARDTIAQRQDPASGGYYKTNNTKTIEIWYTDNIGYCVPEYLNRLQAQACFRARIHDAVVHHRAGAGGLCAIGWEIVGGSPPYSLSLSVTSQAGGKPQVATAVQSMRGHGAANVSLPQGFGQEALVLLRACDEYGNLAIVSYGPPEDASLLNSGQTTTLGLSVLSSAFLAALALNAYRAAGRKKRKPE